MAARGTRVLDLVAVLDRLRSPGGCPWDAQQTHASLLEYLIEECYEVVEAVEDGDRASLREELGDVLLQVVFHARIAQDDDGFDIDDVAGAIVDKLITRHPHVFAPDSDDPAARAKTAAEVEAAWHVRKAEQKGRASVVDGIPEHLPALTRAAKVLTRSSGVDIDEPAVVNRARAALGETATEDDLGALLLALVAVARERGWDAEGALRRATRSRIAQIQGVETRH
jgi:XTP/dITP diphosphohydrolase